MSSVDDVVDRLFGDVAFIHAIYSEPIGTSALEPLLEQAGVRNMLEGLPLETQQAAAVGLLPVLLIEWDLVFDCDIESRLVAEHLGRLMVVARDDFRVFFLSPPTSSVTPPTFVSSHSGCRCRDAVTRYVPRKVWRTWTSITREVGGSSACSSRFNPCLENAGWPEHQPAVQAFLSQKHSYPHERICLVRLLFIYTH